MGRRGTLPGARSPCRRSIIEASRTGSMTFPLYLRNVVRERPGDDVEFGFPRGDDDTAARPENRAVAAFLAAGAPFPCARELPQHRLRHGTLVSDRAGLGRDGQPGDAPGPARAGAGLRIWAVRRRSRGREGVPPDRRGLLDPSRLGLDAEVLRGAGRSGDRGALPADLHGIRPLPGAPPGRSP